MNNCIFCKIIKGEIPAYIIYEDDQLMAFLDAFPAQKGHTLIIPKKHYENLCELPEELSKLVLPLAKKIISALKEVLNPEGFNILQNNGYLAGQEVMHYHLHIIPRYKGQTRGIKYLKDESYHPTKSDFKNLQEDLIKKLQ